jgi:cell division protein FtsA
VAKDPYLVAVDIGSNSIKLAVAKDNLEENDRIQILSLVEGPVNGIKKGVVTNMQEATDSLMDVISQTEAIIGLPIKQIVVGVNGNGISFINSEGLAVISRGDNEIGREDIDRVVQDSLTKAFGIGKNEILHVIPKSYSIDNQEGIKSPIGMIANKLEARTLVVSMETSHLRNFTKVFTQAELDILDRIFTPLASSDFTLSTKQKKSGTMLIDLGHYTTSYIIWENEEIISSGVIPIGSDYITSDLAIGLQTNIEMAEEIKKQHLNFSDEEEEFSEIEVYNPDTETNETFKLYEAKDVAKARVEEIFGLLKKELRHLGRSSLPGGAVLIGGGAKLQGIEDVAKGIFKMPIFKCVLDKNMIEFVPDYKDDPTFVNCISLAAYSIWNQEEMEFNKNFDNFSALHSHHRSGENKEDKGLGNFLKKILPWT